MKIPHKKSKEMVEKAGYPVYMGSPYCEERQTNKAGCCSCEYEFGCKKYIDMRIINLAMEKNKYLPQSVYNKEVNRILFGTK